VVLLTGSLVHRATLRIQGLHVDGYITKPVDLDKFIGVVKSLRRSWLAELVLSPWHEQSALDAQESGAARPILVPLLVTR